MNRFKSLQSDKSEKDLYGMSKAIFDELKTKLDKYLKDMEAEVTMRLGSVVEKRLGEFESKIDKRMPDLLRKETDDLVHSHDTNLKGLDATLKSIVQLIKSMPVPQVNVNVEPTPISISNPPVNVNVEPTPISISNPPVNVNVEPTPINVNIPEQKKPEISVNVKVPENAIQVKVEQSLSMPKRTATTEKSVIYGATGRPETIIEKVTEE